MTGGIRVREDTRDVPIEWKARKPEPDELPRNAKSLLAAAEDAGAYIFTTWAKGYTTDAQGNRVMETVREGQVDSETGEPILTANGKQAVKIIKTANPRVVESVAVRLRRSTDWLPACAVWVEGKLDLCAVLGNGMERVSVSELKTWLTQ